MSPEQAHRAFQFSQGLYRANEVQNLTRITGAEGFVEGHLRDAAEGMKFMRSSSGPRVDLGSGSGVPGLLIAALEGPDHPNKWALVESEFHKSEYLATSVKELGLTSRVTIHHSRIESVANQLPHGANFVARALGKIEKISQWISDCSTWNTLVLFKGPGWDDEWRNASELGMAKKMTIHREYSYESAGKKRVLIEIAPKK